MQVCLQDFTARITQQMIDNKAQHDPLRLAVHAAQHEIPLTSVIISATAIIMGNERVSTTYQLCPRMKQWYWELHCGTAQPCTVHFKKFTAYHEEEVNANQAA
jgi:hypothetical protein